VHGPRLADYGSLSSQTRRSTSRLPSSMVYSLPSRNFRHKQGRHRHSATARASNVTAISRRDLISGRQNFTSSTPFCLLQTAYRAHERIHGIILGKRRTLSRMFSVSPAERESLR
jgi:hypothetical protein